MTKIASALALSVGLLASMVALRASDAADDQNSSANKSNPDPTVEVPWGDQTWEEMMFTSIVYTIDGVAPGAVITPQPSGGQRH